MVYSTAYGVQYSTWCIVQHRVIGQQTVYSTTHSVQYTVYSTAHGVQYGIGLHNFCFAQTVASLQQTLQSVSLSGVSFTSTLLTPSPIKPKSFELR